MSGIVIGDLHGNLKKTEAFLAYRPEVPHIVTGDYFDSFTVPPMIQVKSFMKLLESGATLLYGNHDLHYLKDPPFKCSGYQKYTEDAQLISNIINNHKKDLVAAVVVDDYLITHAGLHRELVQPSADINKQCKWLNGQMTRYLNSPKDKQKSSIFNISRARGGWDPFGGIFWADHHRDNGVSIIFNQIFGHTERPRPEIFDWKETGKRAVALDVTNSNECWVYDTEKHELIELPLLSEYSESSAATKRFLI